MSKKKQSSRGLLFFGIFWTAFSSIFAVVGVKQCYDAQNRTGWDSVPCTVTYFEVSANPNHDPPFQPQIKYTYQWQNITHTGNKIWADKKGEDDYEDLAELINRHRNGEMTTCRVNPDAPEESVMIASFEDVLGGIAFAAFGCFFVAIGIGMVFWSRKQKKKNSAALSSKKTSDGNAPNIVLIPAFGLFFVAGLGILCFLIIPHWIKYFDAQSWVKTPAKIIWSRVESHSDDDGTTYSVDIFYRYEFEGKSYKSNTVGLMSGSSSGRDSKQEKVNNHPPGKDITCYVNPEKPWQALLERNLSWWALFSLFPLPFLAGGAWGLWWVFCKRMKSPDKRKASRSSSRSQQRDKIYRTQERKTFKPGGKRIGSLIGALAIALFWNGITSAFSWQAIESWQRGKPDWLLTIFITPFVLIGIGFIAYAFYRLFALFNPTSTITLIPGNITLGEPAKLKWNTSSGAYRFQHFAIYLVGAEEATYRRGTDSVTDTEVFYEHALIDSQDPRKSITGSAHIELPTNTMGLVPSWKSKNNRIRWTIHVKGSIAFWPDVSDKYNVTVNPVNITT